MSTNSLRSIRLACIAASYLVFAFLMMRVAILPQPNASDHLFGSGLAVFVTMACVADAALLGRPIAFGARFPFAITWPVALPIYLLRSRGWWGVLILLVIAGSLIGMAIAGAAIGVTMKLLMR